MSETPIDRSTIIQFRDLEPEFTEYKTSDLPTATQVLSASKGDIESARRQEGSLEISDHSIELLTNECLSEINRIELAARNPEKWKILKSEAQQTRLIVNLSAPGTYLLPVKEDRFNGNTWAVLMDRIRADTAAVLGIHLAGIATNNDYSMFTQNRLLDEFNPELNEHRPDVRKSIQDANIHFLYLGNKQEADAIRKVVNSKSSFIPPDMVDIFDKVGDKPIDNTIDQVLVIKQYLIDNPNLFQAGARIDFVLGPQAIRTLRMCSRYEAIPEALIPQVFPVPTPKSGIQEYPTWETRGAICRVITNQASINPTPYKIIGE